MNTLANQSANGTYSNTDRTKLQLEVTQLKDEITNIGSGTKFNGIQLLNGASTVTFQTGVNNGDSIAVTTTDMKTAALNLTATTVATSTDARAAITAIETAIGTVSTQRATFGAVQNRLEHTINNLGVNKENLSAAHSRIRDADMAAEMTAFTKNQILVQAGTSMLAQANSVPQNVLKLLG